MESHWNVTLEMCSFRIMVKRRGGKKQREETDNQQHVIMTEKILFKGLTTKGIRNYNRKYSGKLDNYGRWSCGSNGQESSTE